MPRKAKESVRPEEYELECSLHGISTPAIVCQHLHDESLDRGFILAEPKGTGHPLYDAPAAWCALCEYVRKDYGWNDETEAFSRPRILCLGCFRSLEKLHTPGNESWAKALRQSDPADYLEAQQLLVRLSKPAKRKSPKGKGRKGPKRKT